MLINNSLAKGDISTTIITEETINKEVGVIGKIITMVAGTTGVDQGLEIVPSNSNRLNTKEIGIILDILAREMID